MKCSVQITRTLSRQHVYFRVCLLSVASSSSSSSSWIHSKWVPKAVQPYLQLSRADKQIGTMLLLWPCIWSASLAAPMGTLPDLLLLSKFGVGALIMRSAGCVINDLWDKDFDKQVERTKDRPLARGDIKVPQALAYLGGNLAAGLAVLLTFNTNSILLGLCSMPLVVAYPLMKRITFAPQLVLGLTFNWGALVGWTAVTGSLSLVALPLYFAGVCWTLVYDTIYGYQDVVDDSKLGLKSMPLLLGDRPQWALTAFATAMATGLVCTGIASNLGHLFYFGAAAATGQVLWQIWTADLKNRENLWSRFKSNQIPGALITAGIIAGHF